MSSKTASYIRWHHDDRIDDDVLRHPAHSPALDTFDILHAFSFEPRNVRLGLACDGFNLIELWALNIVRGLSHWFHIICLHGRVWSKFILGCLYSFLGFYFLTMILMCIFISFNKEPKRLLIDKVDTYHHSRKETFRICAQLLWTIGDFPDMLCCQVGAQKGFIPLQLAIKIQALLD